jgi:hypothetical protein
MDITQKKLKKLVKYNKNTGSFVWRVNKGIGKAGDDCGTVINTGVLQVGIDGVKYSVHRLIFLYETGKIPNCGISHLDGNKLNNKLSNLALKGTEGITQDGLKNFVTYSKQSGLFRWKKNYLGGKHEGKVCGSYKPGMRSTLTIKGRRYFEDRLAFLYVKGKMPKKTIMHLNSELDDNCWENLEIL